MQFSLVFTFPLLETCITPELIRYVKEQPLALSSTKQERVFNKILHLAVANDSRVASRFLASIAGPPGLTMNSELAT